MSVFDGARITWGKQGPPGGATVEQVGDLETRVLAVEDTTIPAVLNDLSDVSGTPATGDLLQYNGSGWVPYTAPDNETTTSIQLPVGGGGAVISTGVAYDLMMDFNGTVTEWVVLADQTGSIQFDIWSDVFGSWPPTVADSICGTDKPRLVSGSAGGSTALTGWNTTVNYGDIWRVNVDSASTITRCTLIVFADRIV